MKKNGLGLGLVFLLLAVLVLVHGYFGRLPFTISSSFWVILSVGFLGFFSLKNFLQSNVPWGVTFALLAFLSYNAAYKVLPIGIGTLFIAVVLIHMGLVMIFKPRKNWMHFVKNHGSQSVSADSDVVIDNVFGETSKYINSQSFTKGQADVVFGSANIYFDNVQMAGDSAIFDLDVAFGEVTLYVPKDWLVEVQSDTVFGQITVPPKNGFASQTLCLNADVVFSTVRVVYV